jgi:hypothetical protein
MADFCGFDNLRRTIAEGVMVPRRGLRIDPLEMADFRHFRTARSALGVPVRCTTCKGQLDVSPLEGPELLLKTSQRSSRLASDSLLDDRP